MKDVGIRYQQKPSNWGALYAVGRKYPQVSHEYPKNFPKLSQKYPIVLP